MTEPTARRTPLALDALYYSLSVVFSLAIFYWAVASTMSEARAGEAVAKDARQIDYDAPRA